MAERERAPDSVNVYTVTNNPVVTTELVQDYSTYKGRASHIYTAVYHEARLKNQTAHHTITTALYNY